LIGYDMNDQLKPTTKRGHMLTLKNGALDLVSIGKDNLRQVRRNYSTARLVEEIIRNREGQLTADSAIVVRTGHSNERAQEDIFIVNDSISEEKLCLGPQINQMQGSHYDTLISRLMSYLMNKSLYVQNCYAGDDQNDAFPIRIVTEKAWHSLVARHMYSPIYDQKNPEEYEPVFSVIHVPGFQSIPDFDGTGSQSAMIIHLDHKIVIVCGSCYAGTIRQAVATMIHYMVPEDILLMKCTTSMTPTGDIALFMGRERTGKTTLAMDSKSVFMGDYLHGWGPDGIVPFDNGVYPSILNTKADHSPEIHSCINSFGTILENVSIDLESRHIDLDDSDLTINTRACFPKKILPHPIQQKKLGHPRHFILVTCDATGVLPPLTRISPEQAILGFLSSYSASFLQANNGGIQVEQNFCFGALSPLCPPHTYAEKLRKKILDHDIACWIINTGWCGEQGNETNRFPIKYSRAAVRAVMSHALNNTDFAIDPIFRYRIPTVCPGIPKEMLNPRNQVDNNAEYELRANRLVADFINDFSKYEDQIPEDLKGLIMSQLPTEDLFGYNRMGFSM